MRASGSIAASGAARAVSLKPGRLGPSLTSRGIALAARHGIDVKIGGLVETGVGKTHPTKAIQIVAVDVLAETYDEFVDWLRDYLGQNQNVNVAQVRDAFSTSRKYALALLEYTDEQRITKRVGDERVLRA